MKCPNCTTPLAIAERHHIEIDYCPDCRGVWLDRGELDKIIERAAGEPARPIQARHDGADDRFAIDRRESRRKREGFLGELFDF